LRKLDLSDLSVTPLIAKLFFGSVWHRKYIARKQHGIIDRLLAPVPREQRFFQQLLVFDGSSIDPHVTVTVEVDYVVGDVAADDDEYGIFREVFEFNVKFHLTGVKCIASASEELANFKTMIILPVKRIK